MSIKIVKFCKCGIQLPKNNRTGLCRFCYRIWFSSYMNNVYWKRPEIKKRKKEWQRRYRKKLKNDKNKLCGKGRK